MVIINTLEQVEELKKKMYDSSTATYEKIKASIQNVSAIDFLFDIKFNKIGFDPIKCSELNVIEQINQLFSNLVVMEAVKQLLTLYPEKSFELHLGTESGFDIEATDGTIIAECFAVTTAGSNGKLKKDTEKLISKAKMQKKYIFFYSHNDKEDTLKRVYNKYPEVTYKRIQNINLTIEKV